MRTKVVDLEIGREYHIKNEDGFCRIRVPLAYRTKLSFVVLRETRSGWAIGVIAPLMDIYHEPRPECRCAET